MPPWRVTVGHLSKFSPNEILESETKGRRTSMARPRFNATHDQKRNVEAMAAYGIDEQKISRTIGEHGIDPKTLRKHFRYELDIGATKANSAVEQTTYQMATSGKCPAATMIWLMCRAG